MKRVAVLLFALAALLAPAGVRAQAITAGFGGNVSSLINVPFDVPLLVDMTARPERLGAFAARIQWNPAVLQYQVGVNGNFGTITTNTDSAAQGVIRFTGANPAGATGLVTLGIGRFLPLKADTITLVLSLPELYAAGTFTDLRPSVTVTNGQFCPAAGRFGDIDGDGQINSRDALIALMSAVGLDVSQYTIALGDVDGNGVTDTRDALIILSNAVGINVSAFHVGVIMGGACASLVPVTIAITPSVAAGVLPGQSVSFEVRAVGPTGALVIIPNPVLKSSDNTILTFQGGSNPATAVAVGAGTATVTAIRDGRDSIQATVTVVARRYNHIVDAKAASATNQLGTAPFPFATIAQGIGFARDSDTVEVRVGRYPESVNLDRQVVLLGDTLPDGSRPLIALDSLRSYAYAGLNLVGPGRAEANYFDITGYSAAVDVHGPSHALLRGLRTSGTSDGIVVDSAVGFLRLESSRLVGLSTSSYGYGVLTNAFVDTLVLQGMEISDFGYGGVRADGDSVAVLQSLIHDVGGYGISVSQVFSECGVSCLQGSAFTMSGSTIARTRSDLVYLDPVRSAWFSHNHLNNPSSYYGVEVYGVYGATGAWAHFTGDSLDVYEDWVYAEYLDSLSVDSVWVRSPYPYGETYDVSTVRMTNTQFVNAQEQALYVAFGGVTVGGQVFLDNVSVIGDPSCDLCAEVLQAYGPRVTANRITGINLYRGLDVEGDSSFTLTNSLFRHVEYPVYWDGSSSDSTSRLTVTGTTFSGFYEAISAYYGGLAVDGNTFQNGASEGLYWDGYHRARVTQNSFASVEYPVELYAYTPSAVFTDTIADNVITDLQSEGIYVDASDSVPFQILRNNVTCNQTGRTNGYGIDFEYSSGVVAGNQVNGCSSGIYVYDYNGPSTRADSIRGNSVTVPANAYYAGIYVEGSIKANIASNVLTADTSGSLGYGVIAMYGSQPGATATIDSNTITGGTTAGIYVTYLDTALVRYNTVQGVKAPNTYRGGIVTDGNITYLAQIYGNAVRSVHGNGIRIYNGDTAMVQVDSNLVDASSADGIRLDGGAGSITRNQIENNAVGVEYASYSINEARTLVTENNIVGNMPYGISQPLDATLQAPNNWWGDQNGPSCQSETCLLSVVGDSVSGSVNVSPFATAVFGNTPAPAARAMPVVAMRPGAGFQAIRAPAPTGREAPMTKKVHGAAAVRPVRAARAQTEQALAHLSPALAQVRQRAAQLRAAAATAQVQRDQARVVRAAARAQQQQARALVIEQRSAQHEAKLKAKQARQAAAHAASAHVVQQ